MQRRLRLLWVTPNLPRRGVSAAQERWWSLLGRLAARHDVTLLAFVDAADERARDALPAGLAEVHLVPRTPWRPVDPLALLPRTVAGGFSDPSLSAAIAARLAAGDFDCVQYEFVEMAALAPPTDLPTILTVHQLGFAQEGPQWHAEGRRLLRAPIFLHRHLRELDFELRAVASVRRVVTMSPEDAARLRSFHPGLRLSVSPVGVDCNWFQPPTAPPPPDVDLVFVGHFGHPPNADAVRFLVQDVLPRVGMDVRVRIVGHAIPPAVAALARPDVDIVGAVPDVRPELVRARAVVAPVRFGTGMRGKVLEALAMGRPVVTTSVGAEGLGATAGTHLLVADDAAALAGAVRRVLTDADLARQLGAAGRALAVARFDWDRIAAAHDAIYDDVLRDPPRAGVPTPGPPALARLAGRAGHLPGVAAGFALLAVRAVAWHLRSPRGREPGLLLRGAGGRWTA